MEPNQLIQIAKDAQINHWPPHLGLNTDAERIYWLACQLENAAGAQDEVEDLAQKLSDADANYGDIDEELKTIKAELKKAQDAAKGKSS